MGHGDQPYRFGEGCPEGIEIELVILSDPDDLDSHPLARECPPGEEV